MNLRIRHKTRYRYAKPVSFGPHSLLLRPRQYHDLQVHAYSLTILPKHRLRWIRDLQENDVGILELPYPTSELSIEMECLVHVAEENPFNFALEPEVAEFPFDYKVEIATELGSLTNCLYTRDTDCIRDWLHPIWHPGKRCETLAMLQEINKALYKEIKYKRRDSKGVQTPAETLERKTGACRDFAALFMEICRELGMGARFVSGYMYSEDITGRMSMHGWAEVYLPGAGWLGFDPSWGIVTTSSYIPVAVSVHPEHIPPISGTYFGLNKDFLGTDVDLYVERVED